MKSPKSFKELSKKLGRKIHLHPPSLEGPLEETPPAMIPVFELPRIDLCEIPEEAEIHQGFSVNMSVKPHQTRRFSGLKDLSNIDEELIKNTATSAVKYKTYSCQSIPRSNE